MIAKRLKRRRPPPLEVELTVVMNLGDGPQDAVTLVDERRVPLVGSVFANRDRIARSFLRLIASSPLRSRNVMRKILQRR
jgi:hypothetical protein